MAAFGSSLTLLGVWFGRQPIIISMAPVRPASAETVESDTPPPRPTPPSESITKEMVEKSQRLVADAQKFVKDSKWMEAETLITQALFACPNFETYQGTFDFHAPYFEALIASEDYLGASKQLVQVNASLDAIVGIVANSPENEHFRSTYEKNRVHFDLLKSKWDQSAQKQAWKGWECVSKSHKLFIKNYRGWVVEGLKYIVPFTTTGGSAFLTQNTSALIVRVQSGLKERVSDDEWPTMQTEAGMISAK